MVPMSSSRAVGAGTDEDLHLAGLEYRLQIQPEKPQLARGKLQRHGTRMTGIQADLGEAFELEQRPRHACELVVGKQKYRLFRSSRAVVDDVDADHDRILLRDPLASSRRLDSVKRP